LTIQNKITTKLFYKKRQKIYRPYRGRDVKKLRQL